MCILKFVLVGDARPKEIPVNWCVSQRDLFELKLLVPVTHHAVNSVGGLRMVSFDWVQLNTKNLLLHVLKKSSLPLCQASAASTEFLDGGGELRDLPDCEHTMKGKGLGSKIHGAQVSTVNDGLFFCFEAS